MELMTAKTMAEVLAAHWSVSTHADNEPEPPVDKCDGCGKVLHTWGDQIPEVHPLAAHQAAALSAAGFGLVADAKAEAFTERQAKEWPRAVAEVQRYVDTSTVPLGLHDWTVQWEDETRPGRGHLFDGTWTDGEYFAQVRMDVYGYASISVAETTWLHNSSNEECDCEPCADFRDDS